MLDYANLDKKIAGTWNVEITGAGQPLASFEMIIVAGCRRADPSAYGVNSEPFVWPDASYTWVTATNDALMETADGKPQWIGNHPNFTQDDCRYFGESPQVQARAVVMASTDEPLARRLWSLDWNTAEPGIYRVSPAEPLSRSELAVPEQRHVQYKD